MLRYQCYFSDAMNEAKVSRNDPELFKKPLKVIQTAIFVAKKDALHSKAVYKCQSWIMLEAMMLDLAPPL